MRDALYACASCEQWGSRGGACGHCHDVAAAAAPGRCAPQGKGKGKGKPHALEYESASNSDLPSNVPEQPQPTLRESLSILSRNSSTLSAGAAAVAAAAAAVATEGETAQPYERPSYRSTQNLRVIRHNWSSFSSRSASNLVNDETRDGAKSSPGDLGAAANLASSVEDSSPRAPSMHAGDSPHACCQSCGDNSDSGSVACDQSCSSSDASLGCLLYTSPSPRD